MSRTLGRNNLELYQRLKYLTWTADLHLFFPIFFCSALAYRTTNKPAQVAGFKLPGRTHFFSIGGAVFYNPTRLLAFIFSFISSDQKKHLPFDSGRYSSPSLLVAVHSLKRCTEKLGHLLLSLFHFVTELFEFGAVHNESQMFSLNPIKKYLVQSSQNFTGV